MSEKSYRDIELESGTVMRDVREVTFPGDGRANIHRKGGGYHVVPEDIVPEEVKNGQR